MAVIWTEWTVEDAMRSVGMEKWKRICSGLYVDPSGRWVVSSEGRNLYSIRWLTGWWGRANSGEPFPDYDPIWYGDARTLKEAKQIVEDMVASDFIPSAATRRAAYEW